jgi:O-antigen/teichoic acid export membrane protein
MFAFARGPRPDIPRRPDPVTAAEQGVGYGRLTGNGLIYALANIAPVVTAVAITPSITRLLGAVEYGVVATNLVVVQVIGLLATLGLPSAVTRHALIEKSGMHGAGRLVFDSAVIALGLGALTAVTSPFWAPLAMSLPWRPAVLWATLAGAALSIVTCSQGFLRARAQAWKFVLVAAALSVGAQLGALVLVSQTAKAESYLAGLSLIYSLIFVALMVDLATQLRRLPMSSTIGWSSDLKSAIGLGLPTLPHGLSMVLVNGIAVLMASAAEGSRAAGQLQLMLLVGGAPALALSALNNAWAPAVYALRDGHRGPSIQRTSRVIALGLSSIVLVVALLAPIALRLLAPAEQLTGAPLWSTTIIAASALTSLIYLSNVHLVFSAGRTTALAWVTPLSLGASVACGYGLMRMIGLAGLASIPLLFYTSQAIAMAVLRRRVSTEHWSERGLVITTAATLSALVGTCAIPTSPDSSFLRWSLALLVILTAAVVLGAAAKDGRRTNALEHRDQTD